jgi:hypothetical protein
MSKIDILYSRSKHAKLLIKTPCRLIGASFDQIFYNPFTQILPHGGILLPSIDDIFKPKRNPES